MSKIRLPIRAVMLKRLMQLEGRDGIIGAYCHLLEHAGREVDGEGLAALVMAASKKAESAFGLYMRVRAPNFIYALCHDGEIAKAAVNAVFMVKTTPQSQPIEQRP